MHITLQPDESTSHKTPVDVTFYVLKDTPTEHVDNESVLYGKDIRIESPANIVHYLSNDHEQLAYVIVIKVPRQK